MIPRFRQLLSAHTDDSVDRLSHLITVNFLIIFAVTLTTKQMYDKPIHCWQPAEWKLSGWRGYADNYCWVSNTYVVDFDVKFPEEVVERRKTNLAYYQWVPVILMFQALLFVLPHVVWKLLHSHVGLNLDKIMNMAELTQALNPVQRQETIELMADIFNHWIRQRQNGKYLAMFYTAVKIWYLANVVGQFIFLNTFLGMDYTAYGFEVLKSLTENKPWKESQRFPYVTFCDLEIRQLSNVQRYTIQCVLPINLYNEKIFAFMWFWMFLVFVSTLIQLIRWSVVLVLHRYRYQFVLKFLDMTGLTITDFDESLFNSFVNNYLREDGFLVLRAISHNVTDMATMDLVVQLWRTYQESDRESINSDRKRLNEVPSYEETSPLVQYVSTV